MVETKTIVQMASSDCRIAQVFHQNKLDFCCGAKLHLREACEEQGVPYSKLVHEIEETLEYELNQFEGLQNKSLQAIIDHIMVNHHDYVHEKSKLIVAFLNKLKTSQGELFPFVHKLQERFEAFVTNFIQHISHEENTLFPMIVSLEKHHKKGDEICLDTSNMMNEVMDLIQDHSHASQELEEFRAITESYSLPQKASQTHKVCYYLLKDFEANIKEHITIEDHILFPKVVKMLVEMGVSI